MNAPKIKVLSRNPLDYKRSTKLDIHKVYRNYDKKMHPFSNTIEYNRALNASKLDRIFAKPFVASLDGHRDGVYCMSKHPKQLNIIYSGACDGVVKVWDLSSHNSLQSISAHRGFVRGICIGGAAENFITIGDDKMIKIWKDRSAEFSKYNIDDVTNNIMEPIAIIPTNSMLLGIDHNWHDNKYATCGTGEVEIREEISDMPTMTFKWDIASTATLESNTMYSIKFNPVENYVLAGTCSDRSVILYDIRNSTPIKKFTLQMKSNTLAWNPMQAYYFTCANEDTNLYTFDMRNLDTAVNVHKDNLSAVMDVDYCPTGREIVSGGYDKTIRIFPVKGHGHSREIYHTKRMQHVFGVKWSLDTKYIISCSDETNIRIWKANASEKLLVNSFKEKVSLQYKTYLKEKYKDYPQVKRILKHRHLTKVLYKSTHERKLMENSRRRKEINRKKHSKHSEESDGNSLRKNVIVSVEN